MVLPVCLFSLLRPGIHRSPLLPPQQCLQLQLRRLRYPRAFHLRACDQTPLRKPLWVDDSKAKMLFEWVEIMVAVQQGMPLQ
jgi:hypothetical protein